MEERKSTTLRRCLPRLAHISLLTTLLIPSPACKVDDDDGGGGGTTEGMPPCPECDPGHDVYACIIDGNEELFCFANLSEAQQSCGIKPGNGVVGNGPVTCDNQDGETAEGWSPAEYVAFGPESDTRTIDRSFFDDVLAHPDQLLHDSARVRWQGGSFKFESVEPDDLAYALGFRSGDVLQSINGYELATANDAFTAFDALYGSRAFTVHVLRSNDPVVLQYTVQ